MKSYKSYKFSDSEYNGTTITNMIEHYWSNISNQTYGIASFLNSSNAFSGTYYKHDNNNGFIIFSGQSPSYKTQKGIMMNGNWTWTSLVTNTDLGNATFWFPTFVLGWDSYTNGTHQLTQSIANKPLLICAGKNGSLSGFWARTQANDDRVIMTPEGAITIHFDSLTQVTITGATSTWNVRSIQIF